MPGEFRCECGGRVTLPDGGADRLTCPSCGLDYAVGGDRPDVLWRDDPTAALALSSADGATKKPPPRRAGEPLWAPPTVTMQFYERLANTPSRHRRRRRRKRIRQALAGGGLLAVAAVVYYCQLDVGLLHLGSLIPAGAALVLLIQAMLGNDR